MKTLRWPAQGFGKRLAFALLAVLTLLPTLGTVVLAEVYAQAHTNPPCHGLFNSPADLNLEFREIMLTARDDVQVPAWYVPAQNGAVIIAAPGFNGNRSHALADFGFLASNGYGMLVFDQRHCSNKRTAQTLGYNEAQDMLGAVDFLLTQDGVEHIGVIGFSAGGVTTILAAAQEPAIEAVVEAGGYHDLEADITDPQEEHSIYDTILRRFIVASFKRQSGVHPAQSSPISVVADISPRPLLLIYGEREALSGELLFEAALEPKQLWIVEGADHGQYRAFAPEEYEQRVLNFFATHLIAETEP